MAAREKKAAQAAESARDERVLALDRALADLDKQFGRGTVMKLGGKTNMQVDAVPTRRQALGFDHHQQAGTALLQRHLTGGLALTIDQVHGLGRGGCRCGLSRRVRCAVTLMVALLRRGGAPDGEGHDPASGNDDCRFFHCHSSCCYRHFGPSQLLPQRA